MAFRSVLEELDLAAAWALSTQIVTVAVRDPIGFGETDAVIACDNDSALRLEVRITDRGAAAT